MIDQSAAKMNDIIYLSNLHYDVDEISLMSYINAQGFNPKRAKVLTDRESGRSKGTAFVQLQTVKEAIDAIEHLC